jgi:T5SS/PEP-CTERM-associated repeat protein
MRRCQRLEAFDGTWRSGGIVLVALFVGLHPMSALGVITNFNTDAGPFTSSISWDNGAPGADDTAVFRRGNVPIVAALFGNILSGSPAHPTINRLIVGTNPLSLTGVAASTLTVNEFLNFGGDTIIGAVATDVAVLNLNISGLSTQRATLGNAAGSSGTLNLNNATTGTFAVTGTSATYDLTIGFDGTGAISVSNGRDVTVADETMLGLNSTGAGSIAIDGAGSTWTSGGGLRIGGDGDGTLSVSGGGTVASERGYLGNFPGSNGMATISGATSLWAISNFLNVGSSGDGILDIIGGGKVTSDLGYIGAAANSTGNARVDGPNSVWDIADSLSVGSGGLGTLQVLGGGKVEDVNGFVASASVSTGEAIVSGQGSVWANSLDLHVGYGGDGALMISDRGRVTNQDAYVGFQADSSGEVTVAGTGTLWDSSSVLYVGHDGDGAVHIAGGAQVQNTDCRVGYNSGSTGEVTVSGLNTQWLNEGLVQIGGLGSGSVSILNGGLGQAGIVGTTVIGDLANSVGTMTVDGVGSTWTTPQLNVGAAGAGTLHVTEGGFVSAAGTFYVGGGAGGNGDVVVDDARLETYADTVVGQTSTSDGTVTVQNLAAWDHYTMDPADLFAIGDLGVGTLNILSGGNVILHDQTVPTLGNSADGHGIVNIDGVDSELSINIQNLSVGRFGTGELNVTNGGALVAPSSAVLLGENIGADGTVRIAGANSKLDVSSVHVGYLAAGTVDIESGGQLLAVFEVVVAGNENTSGVVTVDGSQSRISVSNENGLLIVGGDGDGSLTISSGAVAQAPDIVLGDGLFATGEVVVTGAGSQLAGEAIEVGNNGVAALTVADGGVAAAPIIAVNDLSSVHGDGTLEGDVFNAGLVAPGTSPGTLSIDGDYEQLSAGTLAIELGPASFNQLQITGAATLSGTLEVTVLDGFAPSGEQFLPILTATVVNNPPFVTELLPTIPGVTFDVLYNATAVVLHITAPLLTGDYNQNGAVDAADFVVWRENEGTNNPLPNDPLGGTIGPAQYNQWRANFGEVASGSGQVENSAVPEASALSLSYLAALAIFWGKVRHNDAT